MNDDEKSAPAAIGGKGETANTRCKPEHGPGRSGGAQQLSSGDCHCCLPQALWNAGATVQAYDPEAMQECQAIYGLRDDLLLCGTKEAALRGADALLIATEWKSFRAPSFDALKDALTTPVIFDGRNLYDPKVVARHGIEYHSIGRLAA